MKSLILSAALLSAMAIPVMARTEFTQAPQSHAPTQSHAPMDCGPAGLRQTASLRPARPAAPEMCDGPTIEGELLATAAITRQHHALHT